MTRPLLVFLVSLLCGFFAQSRELFSVLKLNSALKVSAVGELPPFDDAQNPSNGTAGGAVLGRLRLEPVFETGALRIDAAYDHQLFVGAGSRAAATLALPDTSAIPFRLWPVSLRTTQGVLVDFQQLDRAFVSLNTESLQITLGRQPLGFGRGLFFSAIDFFAPFSPLQIDQEWRPGVDALDLDYKMSERISLETFAVGGESWELSAVGGRARAYFGPLDLELVLGKRKRDVVYGLSSSASIGDIEVHAEGSLFQTPTPEANVYKAVVGASNNFDLGGGLRVQLEYQYNGFGARSGTELDALSKSDAFIERLQDGSLQTLSAHSLGLGANYTASNVLTVSLSYLQSLSDGSGIFSPSLAWDIADNLSLYGSVYVAFGARPRAGLLQSEYGAVTPALLVQLRFYD